MGREGGERATREVGEGERRRESASKRGEGEREGKLGFILEHGPD